MSKRARASRQWSDATELVFRKSEQALAGSSFFDAIADSDARRQQQIENQKASINRMLNRINALEEFVDDHGLHDECKAFVAEKIGADADKEAAPKEGN